MTNLKISNHKAFQACYPCTSVTYHSWLQMDVKNYWALPDIRPVWQLKATNKNVKLIMMKHSVLAKLPTTWILINVSFHNGWSIKPLDISNAFFHHKLEQTVNMCQPPPFIDSEHPTQVCYYIMHSIDLNNNLDNSLLHDRIISNNVAFNKALLLLLSSSRKIL